MKKKQPDKLEPIEIHYRDVGTFRLWRKDWFGDQFNEMEREEFAIFRKQAQALCFRFVDHTFDED